MKELRNYLDFTKNMIIPVSCKVLTQRKPGSISILSNRLSCRFLAVDDILELYCIYIYIFKSKNMAISHAPYHLNAKT